MSRHIVRLPLSASLLALAGACAPSEAPPSRELIELERLEFVPAVAYSLEPFAFFSQRWDLTVPRPIVVDLFELTRRDLRAQLESGRWKENGSLSARLLSVDPAFFDEDRLDWPAFLSYTDAERVAELRGMRLPTATEWIHVAVGRGDLYYPWGQDQSSVANTVETGLGHPTAVGTFESGKGRRFGCYDLVGNVWEWVEGAAPGFLDLEDRQLSDVHPMTDLRMDPEQRGCVMGGAFDSKRRQTYEWNRIQNRYRFHAMWRDRTVLSEGIGARMAADAGDYLWQKAPLWGHDEGARRRIRAVGRRWSADRTARTGLRALLESLLEREGAPEALTWLLEGTELPGEGGVGAD